MAKTIAGADKDPRFLATGICLIATCVNPRVPAVHMNTRFIATTKSWFGGGADLDAAARRPAPAGLSRRRPVPRRAARRACDASRPGAGYERKYKAWCDEYFFLPHRNEPRGIGGIFYDHHNSGDWEQATSPSRSDVGEAFLDVYPQLVRRRMARDLDGRRARGTARAPRPLCRVQPALRPRHDVRPQDRRQRRDRSSPRCRPMVKWP